MKQTALILGLTLLVYLSMKSQDYVPFPKGNVNWNVFYAGTCNETPPDTVLIRYTIHGEKFLGGQCVRTWYSYGKCRDNFVLFSDTEGNLIGGYSDK